MPREGQIDDIPEAVLSDPALLFLYHRVEQILGIRASNEALIKLNAYLEADSGAPFIEKPGAYERMLTSREQIFEISKFVTVNETYFFREGMHFNLMLHHFLPEFAAQKRTIRICCAACSIGCEAYSIAMLLDYFVKNKLDSGYSLDFEIDAFDISAEAIETAKKGCYTSNSVRNDGTDWKYILDRSLVRVENDFTVSDEIRKKVHFYNHNIIRGLEKQYNIIFFRNAMIYFSSKNRLIVMDDLAESLYNGGILFLGVSETSSVRHPLLANRYMSDVFYFQKVTPSYQLESVEGKQDEAEPETKRPSRRIEENIHKKSVPPKAENHRADEKAERAEKAARRIEVELPLDCEEIKALLEKEEGQPNAKKVLAVLGEGAAGAADSLSGSELAAAAVSFLSAQDFGSADRVLSRLEKRSGGPVALFLRGEYCFLSNNSGEAEKKFEEAASGNKAFWPAFYRLSTLAAKGNKTLYEYRIKKAIESLELGKDMYYECFMGGFSPAYFLRILEKKLT